MSTYWLTCKDGTLTIREEVSWSADMQPEFLENLKHDKINKSKKKATSSVSPEPSPVNKTKLTPIHQRNIERNPLRNSII